MSNRQYSPPRLPDELIAEIFQDQTLSYRDLLHCSLVSSKFVETVNKCLYEQIQVDLNFDPIGIAHEDENRNTYDYTTSSWKLLKTLLDHPRLAKYVKELEFDFAYDDERGPGKTGNETSMPQALSTFLRLGSNVRNVIFHDCWRVSHAITTIIQEHKSVTGLSVIDLNEEEEEYCAEFLPHLKRLSIGELVTNRTGGSGRNVFGWSSLEWLELYDGVKTVTEFPSFSASSSTLRTLLVPLDLAHQLDYAQFSVLHTLHLVNDTSEDSDNAGQNCYSSAKNFWKSLCKSPSLHTLIFDTYTGGFAHGYEEALFVSPGVPESPIPSLRIIRFKDDFRIQRALSLLSSPLASTLQSVIVPSSLVQPDTDRISLNTVRAIGLWCDTNRIELVLADIPRVSWTLLSELISLFCISYLCPDKSMTD
jgi:hypothetical protein